MDSQIIKNEKLCPRAELAAYLDGELSQREEIELEAHLAICKTCAAELNKQKKLLCVLDFALDDRAEIELPADFTKIVVASAESRVNGLRSSRERFKALFVCSFLFLAVVFGLGGQIETVFDTYLKFAGQFLAVGGFALHLIYDISVGAAVILRSLGNQWVSNSAVASAFPIAFFLVALLALSRLFARYNRA